MVSEFNWINPRRATISAGTFIGNRYTSGAREIGISVSIIAGNKVSRRNRISPSAYSRSRLENNEIAIMLAIYSHALQARHKGNFMSILKYLLRLKICSAILNDKNVKIYMRKLNVQHNYKYCGALTMYCIAQAVRSIMQNSWRVLTIKFGACFCAQREILDTAGKERRETTIREKSTIPEFPINYGYTVKII